MATLDIVHVVDAVPGDNDKIVAASTQVAAGGPALNAAATAATLGVETVLVSAVGDDPLADLVVRELASVGVRLVDLAASGFRISVSTVLVTQASGARAVVSRNAVGVDGYAVDPETAAQSWLDGVAAVLVDGHHLPLALAVARAAHQRGIPVLLDGGSWKPGLETLLALVDIAVVSSDFRPPSAAPAADVLDALLALGPSWVARSAGADPVTWRSASGSGGVVAVPEVVVVDTLGAGDVLHGALLAEVARHGLTDLPGALGRAVAMASASVGFAGLGSIRSVRSG